MSPKQPRIITIDPSVRSGPPSALTPSPGTITFSHFTDLQPISSTPISGDGKPESEFKVTFQFVGNQDARKATTENRSHVMREYRRKQRWEQEQKKKQTSNVQENSAGGPFIKQEPSSVLIKEEPDLNKIIAMGRAAGSLPKRKRSLEDSETGRALAEELDSETSNLAIQLLAQLTSPQVRQPSLDTPIMDVFTQRFVDNFAPESRNAGSATAIRSIATVRMYSPLLSSAMNAVATTFAGQQVDDKQILEAGHGIYTGVLKSLQQALAHPLYSRSENVLATVVLCMAYESMRHTTPDALAKHCIGALQLLEYRGPHAHVHGLEHLCFAELRPYWAFAAIVFRTPTFLQDAEWKSVPWSAPDTTKDIMQYLLDLVVDIPALLYQFDTMKAAGQDGSASEAELAILQDQLWKDTASLFARLMQWRAEHADKYASGPPIDTKAPLGKDFFPVFRTHNPRTGDTMSPPTIAYPDPQLCRTLCTFYGALIVLASVDTRPVEASASPYGPRTKPLQVFGWASMICRSVEYFIRNVPGNMTNRMMFPLRAAWEVMPKGGPEREFMSGVWAVIEERKASTVWATLTKDDDEDEESMA